MLGFDANTPVRPRVVVVGPLALLAMLVWARNRNHAKNINFMTNITKAIGRR